jgi:hypothetical protein
VFCFADLGADEAAEPPLSDVVSELSSDGMCVYSESGITKIKINNKRW